ncbi:MAG: FAD-dependent oxidoreductase, partial [Natronospirillum sp.]
PVVKIDPHSLPQHPNIHYFGQQEYADLPAFLGGWDLCLMPFALNQSTRFISPTKTLEYMAAERAIVSTPIKDVAEPYGDIVYLGDGHANFINACEEALGASAEEHQRRFDMMRDVLSQTSWDDTAASISDRISSIARHHASVAKAQPSATGVGVEATSKAVQRPAGSPSKSGVSLAKKENLLTVPVAIIGAGPTGLSAAYHLGKQALLVKQNDRVGGWCRSIQDHGFTFDHAGHIMFSNDPYVHEMYELLLGNNVHWQNREAWVYSKNVYTRYPFQGALYGLPADVIRECIVGAIEARFGPIEERPTPPGTDTAKHPASRAHNSDTTAGKPDSITDCCADGILESSEKLSTASLPFKNRRKTPRNFEDFIYETWGAGIAKHFAIPYNKKLWAVPLKEMETSWLGGRVPMPNLSDMLEGALQPVGKPMGPNARFGYPLQGGFQAMMDGFIPHLQGELKLNTKVVSVAPIEHRLTLDDGRVYRYDSLISTMPLPLLIQAMGDAVPATIHEAAERLRQVSVRCVNIGVGRENLTDKHWIYYPEDTVFHRVFVQGNASPHCNPPGGFGLTCEITYSEYKALPCDD